MQNNKTSPIIIGIVVIAFTVAIATTFYVWVTPKYNQGRYVQGWVYDAYSTSKSITLGNKTLKIWNITLVPTYNDYTDGTNKTTYSMVFDGPAPPPEGVNIRLFYNLSDNIYVVYKVKSLG